MGYESKIYIVEGTAIKSCDKDDKNYGSMITMVDMGKQPALHDFFLRNGSAAKHYFYADDDSTIVEADKYGDRLLEVSAKDLLAFMYSYISKELEDGRTLYRRDELLISILENLNNSMKWRNVYCIHFGY